MFIYLENTDHISYFQLRPEDHTPLEHEVLVCATISLNLRFPPKTQLSLPLQIFAFYLPFCIYDKHQSCQNTGKLQMCPRSPNTCNIGFELHKSSIPVI